MTLKEKTLAIFRQKGKTIREAANETSIPKSTVHYHKQTIDKRIKEVGTDFWESNAGSQFLIRLVVSTIFIFGIKSGNGAGRFKEFFNHLRIKDYLPSSETTILRIIKRIEYLILEYKRSVELQIHQRVGEIELILGVDETWFDKMYLVCQELSSGYVFFETEAEQRDTSTWDGHIKKTPLAAAQSHHKIFC
jgi:hypothetical protein